MKNEVGDKSPNEVALSVLIEGDTFALDYNALQSNATTIQNSTFKIHNLAKAQVLVSAYHKIERKGKID